MAELPGNVQPWLVEHDTMVQDPLRTWNDYNPWAGLPGGPLASMLMQMGGSSIANTLGGTPMGFRQSGDLYSTLRQQQVTQEHYENMKNAAGRDLQAFLPLAEKAAREANVPFSASAADVEGYKNYELAKKAFETGGGFLAYGSPGVLDKATGGTSYRNTLHGMHATGQLMVDPVTGFRGLSARTADTAANENWLGNKYDDPAAWAKETAGLTSLEMRDLHGELQRRGLGTDTLGSKRERVLEGLKVLEQPEMQAGRPRSTQDTLRNAGVDPNKSLEDLDDDDIDKLMSDKDVQTGMRAGLGQRVKRTTDKYKGAIDAVKEIFGDNGRSDAPMSELFSALEALTNNSLSQLDPSRLERMVRNLGSVSKQAGIGIGQLQMIFGQGNQLAAAFGLNEAFVPQMALNAVGQRGAYSAADFGSTWGLKSADEIMQIGMAREAAAGASSISNRVGMLMRLADQPGGLKGKALEIVEAAKSKNLEPVGDLLNLSEQDFINAIADDAGLTAESVLTELSTKSRNQEYALPYNIPHLVKTQFQVRELIDKSISAPNSGATNELSSRLKEVDGTLSGDQRRELSETLSKAAGDTVFNLLERDFDVYENEDSRFAAISTTLENTLQSRANAGDAAAASVLQNLNAMDPPDRQRKLHELSRQYMNVAERDFEADNNGQTLISYATPSNQRVDTAQRREMEKHELINTIRTANAGRRLDADPLRRIIQGAKERAAAEGGNEGSIISGMLTDALGIQTNDRIGAGIANDIQQIIAADDALTPLRQELGQLSVAPADETPEQKEKREKKREAKKREIKDKEDARDAIGAELRAFADDPAYKEAFEKTTAEIDKKEKEAEEEARRQQGAAAGGGAGIGSIVFTNATFQSADKLNVITGRNLASDALEPKEESVNGTGVPV